MLPKWCCGMNWNWLPPSCLVWQGPNLCDTINCEATNKSHILWSYSGILYTACKTQSLISMVLIGSTLMKKIVYSNGKKFTWTISHETTMGSFSEWHQRWVWWLLLCFVFEVWYFEMNDVQVAPRTCLSYSSHNGIISVTPVSLIHYYHSIPCSVKL